MSNIFDLFKQIEKKSPTSAQVEWLIVGLGNPGKQYEQTRHNNGFMAIDHMADGLGVRITESKFHSLTARATLEGVGVLLIKPQTLMNRSGIAVGEAASFYKIPPEKVLVLSDDISLDVGKIRTRARGSAGGHNGLKSIIEALGSDAFPRIKIGTGNKPHPDYDLADWVLGKYSTSDMEKLSGALDNAVSAAGLVILGKIDQAMNKYN